MFRRALPLVAIVSICAVGLLAAQTRVIHGRVVAIADGDTITVLDGTKQQHRVRLNGIDAPEARQPFSARARQHLASLVFGRDVIVQTTKTDRYGRLVGTVSVGDTNVNLEQLKAGLAWYYRDYERDVAPEHRPLYVAAEAAARSARIGLWSEPSPQPPWDFRNPPSQARTTEMPTPRRLAGPSPAAPASAGRIIGNRNSGIYHLPACRDYSRVAEHNRIYFDTEEQARAAGFRVARNC